MTCLLNIASIPLLIVQRTLVADKEYDFSQAVEYVQKILDFTMHIINFELWYSELFSLNRGSICITINQT